MFHMSHRCCSEWQATNSGVIDCIRKMKRFQYFVQAYKNIVFEMSARNCFVSGKYKKHFPWTKIWFFQESVRVLLFLEKLSFEEV